MTRGMVHWEIGGHDLEALSGFYEQLFGWSPVFAGEDYRLVVPDEGVGGGLMRCRDEAPPYVTVYVQVDDLDATLQQAKDLGGPVLLAPTPVPGIGAIAMFQDPEGNAVGILRPASSSAGGAAKMGA